MEDRSDRKHFWEGETTHHMMHKRVSFRCIALERVEGCGERETWRAAVIAAGSTRIHPIGKAGSNCT